MLTQIFIKGDGCQSEFTKIVSHSFGFTGDFFLGAQTIDTLYFAGDYDPVNGTDYPVWSATKYDFGEYYTAGSLRIGDYEKTAGIALPINLVSNDKITLSGTAQYNYTESWLNAGFSTVNLIVGVYYFDCSQTDQLRLFTFIPVTTVEFDGKTGTACFSTEVTLGSNFDIHTTRIVIGYNTYITGDGITPGVPTILTVSHTLDIERPCQVIPSNFVIKNCCEGSITELVNIPGLVVGNFHVDNEGNCWEVMEESTDVTNFTRNFVDAYASCAECQAANECPLNLIINSCCVEGQEYVTGSLPGLAVGDTFVDNYGLCWYVSTETGAPISEESITVVSIIEGECGTCTTENPCPNFYFLTSCCGEIGGYIAVPDVLNVGDSFVDAQGQCWNVFQTDTAQLPTIYGIEVVTVYPYQGDGVIPTACDLCITANPCPTEYFITIKSCCDQDRVEVAQVPAEFMSFTEGTIFNDYWEICWEVTSFSTTGIATFEIWPWTVEDPRLSFYKDCRACQSFMGCTNPYQVKDCITETIYEILLNGTYNIGSLLHLEIVDTNDNLLVNSCFELLGYAYPVYPYPGYYGYVKSKGPFLDCPDCLLQSKALKKLEVTPCCGGPNEIFETTIPWVNGIGSVQGVATSTVPGGPFALGCYTLVGLSLGTPTLYTNNVYDSFSGCENCLTKLNIIC